MVVRWENMEPYTIEILFQSIQILIHIKAVLLITVLLEVEGIYHGAHGLYTKPGGIQEESVVDQGQSLDPAFNECIMVA